jgi:hypothetical protein
MRRVKREVLYTPSGGDGNRKRERRKSGSGKYTLQKFTELPIWRLMTYPLWNIQPSPQHLRTTHKCISSSTSVFLRCLSITMSFSQANSLVAVSLLLSHLSVSDVLAHKLFTSRTRTPPSAAGVISIKVFEPYALKRRGLTHRATRGPDSQNLCR